MKNLFIYLMFLSLPALLFAQEVDEKKAPLKKELEKSQGTSIIKVKKVIQKEKTQTEGEIDDAKPEIKIVETQRQETIKEQSGEMQKEKVKKGVEEVDEINREMKKVKKMDKERRTGKSERAYR